MKKMPSKTGVIDHMSIGTRIRELREQKAMSQGDIEAKTGLLRCYISRVENGHTIPSLETLERFAAALEVPLYRFFYSGEDPSPTPNLTARRTLDELAMEDGPVGVEARFLLKLRSMVGQMNEPDREVLLTLARRLTAR